MVTLRLMAALASRVREDLSRKHATALERVGFLVAKAGALPNNGIILLPYDYIPVADEAYVDDDQVGARISDAGFRPARQAALSDAVAIMHVHLHGHRGRPEFSRTDLRESAHFMPDFLKIRPSMPHAAVILSVDEMAGRCWTRDARPAPIEVITFVGSCLQKVRHA